MQDGRFDFLCVVRINNDGIGQLNSCSRHFTEYQNTRLFPFGGKVFFGHQVHAVAQRGNHCDIGNIVKCYQLIKWKTLIEIINGCPAECGVDTVYFTDRLVDLGFQIGVSVHSIA
ncbi:hypothetical protein SDC9_187652 [bioreactor metagenome]|uniref:Uncharacterized protein n=1 Tax=bioreactor metagenome TaxID=1076179 RepID=A0A645HME2_9ZZZZ